MYGKKEKNSKKCILYFISYIVGEYLLDITIKLPF